MLEIKKNFHLIPKKLTFHAYLLAVASSLFAFAGYLAGCRAEEAKHVTIAAFEWSLKGWKRHSALLGLHQQEPTLEDKQQGPKEQLLHHHQEVAMVPLRNLRVQVVFHSWD